MSKWTKNVGTAFAIIGDNLGIHMECGFKEGLTTNNPFRGCMASLEDVRRMTEEDLDLFRTPGQYDQQVMEIKVTQGQEKNHLKKIMK